MTEELKTGQNEVVASSNEDLKNTGEDKAVSEDLKNDEVIDDGDDNYYKAELEKIKKHKENLEKGIKVRDAKLKEKISKEDIDSLLDEKLNKALEERESKIKSEFYANEINNVIDSMATNEEEKELINHYLENKIKRSGFTREDIKNDVLSAKLLANQNKILSSNEAMKNLIKTKASVNSAPSFNSEIKETITRDAKLASGEQSLFERTNERRIKRGEKPLSVNEFINNG